MDDERMISLGFALYPSTKAKLQEYKNEQKMTWDELFNHLLEVAEKEINNV